MTAFKLFFQKGYKEVTMSQLVKETGLSKGAFYHYFSSKEDLYKHTMEMFLDHYLKSFSIEFQDDLTLRENLKALFEQFSPISNQMNTSTEESSEALSNYLIFLQGLMRKEQFRHRLEEYNLQFTKEFSGWIIKCQDRGEIRADLNPKVLAKHLTSLMKGIGVLHAFVDQSEPVQVTFEKIIDQFFNLIET